MYPSSRQAQCVTGCDKELLKPQARRWASPAACKPVQGGRSKVSGQDAGNCSFSGRADQLLSLVSVVY